MKVYFIGNGFGGCYFVRCLLPLLENGWSGEYDDWRQKKRKDWQQIFREAMSSDVIVFHRPDTKDKVEAIKLLQRAGKKVVVDNDDTFKVDAGIPVFVKKLYDKNLHQDIDKNIKDAVSLADLVTTSTETLAMEYREHNKNVRVLPNYIDPFFFRNRKENETGKLRVGLSGSTTSSDYYHIKDFLKELSNDKTVQLVVFGLPPDTKDHELLRDLHKKDIDFWNSLDIEWQPLVPISDYHETLGKLALDILLIPRTDNWFNRCKSNIKYLESGMFKTAVIAQGFKDKRSPYQQDIKDGVNGYVAIKDVDWKEKFEQARENYKQIGENAHDYILKNYNIANHANKWEQLYEIIWNLNQK